MPGSTDANLDRVRALFGAQAEGDYAGTLEFFDETVVWDARGLTIPGLDGVYHGHEGLGQWWGQWLQAWERLDVIEVQHVAHGGQVISWWRQTNRGRDSGIAVDQESGIIWTFQSGLVVRAAAFASHEHLFEAAGLARPA